MSCVLFRTGSVDVSICRLIAWILLGHQSIDDTLRYIEPSPAIMRRACEDVI